MKDDFRIWSETKTGTDGRQYDVRYMLTRQELEHMQKVGLVGDVGEIVGMQTAADAMVAQLEREAMLVEGGRVQ